MEEEGARREAQETRSVLDRQVAPASTESLQVLMLPRASQVLFSDWAAIDADVTPCGGIFMQTAYGPLCG